MNACPGIQLGYVSGVFGVKGWIKAFSYTEPRNNLLAYSSWLLGKGEKMRRVSIEDGHFQGKSIVVKIVGIDTRDQAELLVGRGIYVERGELPDLAENEYYWADLVGLKVFSEAGDSLGIVNSMMETGANDVMVVRGDRERLIPFVQTQVVKLVDIEQGLLVVAWDPDF